MTTSQQRPRLMPALAIVVTLVQTLGTTLIAGGQPPRLDLLGYALLVVSGLALTARRRHPPATTTIIAATTVAYLVLDYPSGPTFLALVIAGVAALGSGNQRSVYSAAAMSYVVWVALGDFTVSRALWLAAWFVGVGLFLQVPFGIAPIIKRMVKEQGRLQEERRRRRASEERLRIAQELHDVLGHHLSLINVRAGVGLHLMDREPDQARTALSTIRSASAEALREVRAVLDALYPDGQAAPRAPAPGLDRLDELTVDAGLPVRTTISGEPRPLPAEIDRAAYRIVQEALTNVRRHAGAGVAATVLIEYLPEEQLMVQIEDDGGAAGPITAPATDGNGVSGMRERAETLGGSLTAQPMPGGGWQVVARLPLIAPEPPRSPRPTWERPIAPETEGAQ